MALNVKLADVVKPQSFGLSVKEDGPPGTTGDFRRLIVYTGWVAVTFKGSGGVTRETAVSFVPNGGGGVQTFNPGAVVQATVTASLSSFGEGPDVAAVDEASLDLESRTFPGVSGSPLVLILRARLAVQNGAFHAFSYQVTLLVDPTMLGMVLSLTKDTHP
jgi:hypothetical protein